MGEKKHFIQSIFDSSLDKKLQERSARIYMYSISANRNRIAYDIKRFIVDFTSDITDLPTNCAPGSTAFVIENSQKFMLNNNRIWVKVITSSGSGGSGGEDGDGDIITEVIYDGGVI